MKQSSGIIRRQTKGWKIANKPLQQIRVRQQQENPEVIQALQWYRKTAEENLAGAQNTLNMRVLYYYLGLMHEQGQGVSQDEQQAEQWYQKAAQATTAQLEPLSLSSLSQSLTLSQLQGVTQGLALHLPQTNQQEIPGNILELLQQLGYSPAAGHNVALENLVSQQDGGKK
ncbi:Sel1 repeat protein [Candidatus Venteria ishoeyi]|uniref:Sel1 repeat protein n=1 Tax=Candidatus Venteria ishoeyi TaxID=1899563 RepID=A0A1H6FDZ0_9GAMM|nr:Sel1 repeat protein [Candidatus Venteria ishoeyi]